MRMLLGLILLLPACATPSRIVVPGTGTDLGVGELADRLCDADVVVLGELHGNSTVHELHRELIAALHERHPGMAIAMEMFERDVQTLVYRYLDGEASEQEFRDGARPWPYYATDYRPVVEYAKAHGIPVLAANAPKALAAEVARKGLDAVAGNPHVAAEVSAPKDDYWQAFKAELEGDDKGAHGSLGPDLLERLYQAQCLKDDTMAETVVGYLREMAGEGERRLLVLVCGRFHSDKGLGTVARIRGRNPALDVRVVSAEATDDDAVGTFAGEPGLSDYLLVVSERANRPEKQVRSTATEAARPAAPAAAAAAPAEGGRPALGIRPDYEFGGDGLLVAEVVEGGPAEQAGLQADDIIVALAGQDVTDVNSYMQALAGLTIGAKTKVVVLRGDQKHELEVKVGSRSQ